jgi:hypothetical protein
MRLDEVYGTVAAFSDQELRAFAAADRSRRRRLEVVADQFFLGWLVRAFASDPLAEARRNATRVLREDGIDVPRPTRDAMRDLLPPVIALLGVFTAASGLSIVGLNVLPILPEERADLVQAAISIGLSIGGLLAWLIAREPLLDGPRRPVDVFGHRLLAALATLYGVMALVAIMPVSVVAIAIAAPEIVDAATIVLVLTVVVLALAGIRAARRARVLNGAWRPFDDAALGAAAHGRIDPMEERLLVLPLETVVRAGAARG